MRVDSPCAVARAVTLSLPLTRPKARAKLLCPGLDLGLKPLALFHRCQCLVDLRAFLRAEKPASPALEPDRSCLQTKQHRATLHH